MKERLLERVESWVRREKRYESTSPPPVSYVGNEGSDCERRAWRLSVRGASVCAKRFSSSQPESVRSIIPYRWRRRCG